MKINKAYKYRIYPNKSQAEFIEKNFAGCRVVYNCLLYAIKKEREDNPEVRQKLSVFAFSYKVTELKRQNDKRWLNECDSVALLYEAENLSNGFKVFFRNLKSNPSDAGYPRFKSKYNSSQSYRTRKSIKVEHGKLKLPKLKSLINIKYHRHHEGKIKQATISRKNGKYYVSLMVEMEIDVLNHPIENTVGMDFGVADFATTSDGQAIENPAFLIQESKYLAVLQQKLSRAVKGSNNHRKLKYKIACLHERIVNKRKHFHYDVIKKVLNNYDKIYIQNLSTKKMTKKKDPNFEGYNKNKLNRKVLDAAPATFHRRLMYKADWIGKQVEKIDKYEPTTATCGVCDHVNSKPQLKSKKWICCICGEENERDINGSENILKAGKKRGCDLGINLTDVRELTESKNLTNR
jgi:putative transposase